MAAPLPVPGLPGGTNLGAYAGTSITDLVHKVVTGFAPMLPVVIPFAIGYMLLMWAVDWVMDHLPWGGAGDGVMVLSEGADGQAISYLDGYGRRVRGTRPHG